MQKINFDELRVKVIERARLVQESAATPAEPSCPICGGHGWLGERVPNSLSVKTVPCDCRIEADRKERIEQARQRRVRILSHLDSELGGKLARCSLENYDLERAADGNALKTMANALAQCRLYVGNPSGWLYLHGPVGVGKSHLAAATARAIAEQTGLATSYTTEPALVSFLRQGWGKQGEQSSDSRMAALQQVNLLVLDDLGTAFRGKGEQAWVDAQLFELLQPRYLNTRPTILTSNLPPDDMEPRLASRIKGEAIIIQIDNSDQRGGRHE